MKDIAQLNLKGCVMGPPSTLSFEQALEQWRKNHQLISSTSWFLLVRCLWKNIEIKKAIDRTVTSLLGMARG